MVGRRAFGLLVVAMLALFVVVVPALVRQFDELVTTSPLLAGKGESLAERLSHSSNGLIRALGICLSGWIADHAGTAPRLFRELTGALLRVAEAGFVILAGSVLGFLFLASREPLVRERWPSSPRHGEPGSSRSSNRSGGSWSGSCGPGSSSHRWSGPWPRWGSGPSTSRSGCARVPGRAANLIPVLGTPIGFVPVALVTLLTRDRRP